MVLEIPPAGSVSADQHVGSRVQCRAALNCGGERDKLGACGQVDGGYVLERKRGWCIVEEEKENCK